MKCQSFNKEFKAGDNLEFKQGNKTAGVFTVPWRHNYTVGSISVEMFFVWLLLTSLQLRYQLCIKDHLRWTFWVGTMNATDSFTGLFCKYVPPPSAHETHEGFFQPLKIPGKPWGFPWFPIFPHQNVGPQLFTYQGGGASSAWCHFNAPGA